MPPLRSFASTDRFLTQLSTAEMRPGYVLLGDETFLYERARQGVLEKLVPQDLRDFCLHDLELGSETTIFEALDLAQTPSLMAPFQVIFIRGLKSLYGRGAKKEEFAALDRYFQSPNPQALILFVADHLTLPTDLRRMEREDKDRYDRIKETLGDHCGIVELQKVEEGDAARWVIGTAEERGVKCDPEAARELVDALAVDMMIIRSELEKLLLYVSAPVRENNLDATHFGHITLGDVETMVLAAKQRSLYELTDALSQRDRPRALSLLHGLLHASDGGEDSAIGHLYMLARTYRQMLIIHEKNVRDSRAIWQVLWQGFRMPPFAADVLIQQARRYKSRREISRAMRLIARADIELRSGPVDKTLVLERLILDLATEPRNGVFAESAQFALEM
ncbi:DNA polymerase III subunit delta [Terriglobus roseus]|uniref:DNA polymerase III subunit delta n=1 Tax=Terriglobus roseus TaxID=392734 RepID=A0A1G7EYF5_9BACT|nr:DNA polymerase III subunit delta [Terriglobus roseus]SDE68694.1 DNA polymerase III, delta subunit [Terriglobus roseus]